MSSVPAPSVASTEARSNWSEHRRSEFAGSIADRLPRRKSARAPSLPSNRDAALIGLVAVGLWGLLSWLSGAYWVPSPRQVLGAFLLGVFDGTLLVHLARTAVGAMAGLCAGFVPGVALPILLFDRPKLLATLDPFAAAAYGMPKLALAPIFVLWFGLGVGSTIALVASATFFLGYIHVAAGVKATNWRLAQAVRVVGGASQHVRRYVVLPGALPYLFAGLRLAISAAIGTTIIAEMLSSNRGLGYVVQFHAMNFDTAGVFAALGAATLFAAMCDSALRIVESRCVLWAGPPSFLDGCS
jgi:NitT/TauT family transport system permease protein